MILAGTKSRDAGRGNNNALLSGQRKCRDRLRCRCEQLGMLDHTRGHHSAPHLSPRLCLHDFRTAMKLEQCWVALRPPEG